MKENTLDVLLYLFQNFMDGDIEIDPDRNFLEDQLVEAGFQQYEIDKAFLWLDDLSSQQEKQREIQQNASFRVYADEELASLDLECRDFLLYLENMGVLTPDNRELVIERVMALDSFDFDIERLKWVILMVLFNQPEESSNYEWIENMVFDSSLESLH
jgi:Smg protein